MVRAIQKQSKKLIHVSNAFEIPEQEKLAKRLTKNSFADFVVFVNSGAEATEASIKIARKYFLKKVCRIKIELLLFEGAFHDRTLAALFAANNQEHIKGFGPKVEGFDQVPFGNHEILRRRLQTTQQL